MEQLAPVEAEAEVPEQQVVLPQPLEERPPQVQEPVKEALGIQLRTWDQVALHIIGQVVVEVLCTLHHPPLSRTEEPVVLEVAGAVLLLLAPEA
jgi:hypothetical protein